MKKNELIAAVTAVTDFKGKDVKKIVETFLGEIGKSLDRGENVEIRDFGVFSEKTLSARKGRNPITGEPMDIPEKKVIRFKAYKKIKVYSRTK